MRNLSLILIGLVITFLIVTAIAYSLLGWAGCLIVVLLLGGLSFVLKNRAGKLLEKAIAAPFLAKGAVLKNARVQVHTVTPALAPLRQKPARISTEEWAELNEEEEPEGPRDYYDLEVTLTPQPSGGTFKLWEPGELALAGEAAKSGETEAEVIEVGSVEAVELWQEGRWQPDEGGKYEGPQRLKLHLSLQPGLRSLRFRYYFEIFGRVNLPAGLLANDK